MGGGTNDGLTLRVSGSWNHQVVPHAVSAIADGGWTGAAVLVNLLVNLGPGMGSHRPQAK